MAASLSGTTTLRPAQRAAASPLGRPDRSAGLLVKAVAKDSRESLRSRRRRGATAERVLRYPGGRERRIRYPLPESSADESDDGFLGDDCYWGGPNELAWGVAGYANSNNIVPHKKTAFKSRSKVRSSTALQLLGHLFLDPS